MGGRPCVTESGSVARVIRERLNGVMLGYRPADHGFLEAINGPFQAAGKLTGVRRPSPDTLRRALQPQRSQGRDKSLRLPCGRRAESPWHVPDVSALAASARACGVCGARQRAHGSQRLLHP